MSRTASVYDDGFHVHSDGAEEAEASSDEDLWFLPGLLEGEPDDLPPGPGAGPDEAALIESWVLAEAAQAAHLARVAGRLGALDDRLHRHYGTAKRDGVTLCGEA